MIKTTHPVFYGGAAPSNNNTKQAMDKIIKMLPMAFVLIILGLSVGLSKGQAIRLGR